MSERVARMVELLRSYDPDRRVFGASQHGWKVGWKTSEKLLAAFETAAGVKLPEDYRAFVRDRWGSGAGPYYGLLALPKASKKTDAIPLADQGCGMTSMLVITGPHRGEVWFDDRACESPSFTAWMEDWIDRSLIDVARTALAVGSDNLEKLIEHAAAPIEKYGAEHAPSPYEVQYPMPPVLPVLGYLRMRQGRFDEALAIFEREAERSPEDREGRHRLARARVARMKDELESCIEEAKLGLAAEGVWFDTRGHLLRELRDASFEFERFEEAIAACEELARHTGNVQDYLMVAWHDVLDLGDVERAAQWILAASKNGVGSIDELLNGGFLKSLENERPDEAKRLRELVTGR